MLFNQSPHTCVAVIGPLFLAVDSQKTFSSGQVQRADESMGCQIRQNYCYTIIRHYSVVIRHCLVIIRHDFSLLGIPLLLLGMTFYY